MNKKRLCAAAAAILLSHTARAASWEVVAGAPVALHAAPLDAPRGIAVGGDGTVYFTDGAVVRAMRPDGRLDALPGRFIAPAGLAVAGDGTVYVADAGNHVVKAVTPAREVRTVAGQAGTAGRQDGRGVAAQFRQPAGLALDASGGLLVADAGNSALRRIAPDGVVGTVAQRLPLQPQGVAVDARGAAVVHDAATALRIGADGSWQALDVQAAARGVPQADLQAGMQARSRAAADVGAPTGPDAGKGSVGAAVRGLLSGAASTVAGSGPAGEADIGDERAATMPAGADPACRRGKCLRRYLAPSMPVLPPKGDMPAGQLATDGQGRLLATVPAAGTIYRIERNGMIVPLLGAGDVTGDLSGVAVDRRGSLHLLLAGPQAGASWDASGKARPLALQYAASLNRDGPALQARFSDITELAVGRDGALYVLDGDQLRRIGKEGEVRTLLQEGGFHKLRDTRTPAQVDLHGVLAARSSTGVFVTANGALAGVSAEGMISLVSGPPGMAPEQTGLLPALRRIWAYVAQDVEPFILPGLGRHRMAADASGQAWYCADNVLWRIRPRGVARKTVLKGTDGCGDVLVAPSDEVFMLHGHYMTRVGADGYQWLAAGNRERKGSNDGAALLARFRYITHAVADAGNHLYFLDDGLLRKLSANGDVTTLANDLFSEVGELRALAVDGKGTLYLATQRSVLRWQP